MIKYINKIIKTIYKIISMIGKVKLNMEMESRGIKSKHYFISNLFSLQTINMALIIL